MENNVKTSRIADVQPDMITVEAIHEVEVEAVAADLHVVIKATSLFTGSAALSNAREVSQLVNELKSFGLKDADIRLEGVHAAVSSGVMGKSSSANYSLKIRCASLDSLSDLLGIITSQKNTILKWIEWDYGDVKQIEINCLLECIEITKKKAKVIADSLGVTMIGIHRFRSHRICSWATEIRSPGQALQAYERDIKMLASRVSDLGMSVSHISPFTTIVSIEYRISEFADA